MVFEEGDWRVRDTARRVGNRFDDDVLLMKRPAAYAYSCAVHEGLSVDESLDRSARTYRGALGFIERTQAPTCVVFFDAFAEQPAIEAERLCRHVGIPYDDANDVFTSMLRLAGSADMSAGAPAPRSP